MLTDEIQVPEEMERCCGTCFYWQSEGGSDFKERIKCRFRLPYCRRDNQTRYAESRRGCFGWKSMQK